MMDLISIIVPVYNVEKYLARCINSIIKQSYKKLEIILVDDGSTDSSASICENFKKKDERINVIHTENKGSSSARNIGVKYSKGNWIAFVDSDDFISIDYIESLYDLCLKYGVLISQCGAVRGCDNHFPKERQEIVEHKWLFQNLYKSAGREFRNVVWGKLYRAEYVKMYPFPEGKIYEDEEFVFKVMYKANECVITNKHMYYYYMSDDSIIRNTKRRVSFDFIDILEDRIRFLKKQKDSILIEYTKKELCIRLVVGYCDAKKKNMDCNDIKKIRYLFLKYYKATNWKLGFPNKERQAIKLFYYFPNLFSFIENHLAIIQKTKYRREKK